MKPTVFERYLSGFQNPLVRKTVEEYYEIGAKAFHFEGTAGRSEEDLTREMEQHALAAGWSMDKLEHIASILYLPEGVQWVFTGYIRHKKKNFNLSKGLVERLQHSDKAGDSSYLKLPYPMFYVATPGLQYYFMADDEDGEPKPFDITGLFVCSGGEGKIGCGILVTDGPRTSRRTGFSYISIDIERMEIARDRTNCREQMVEQDRLIADFVIKFLLYLNSERPEVTEGGQERAQALEKLKKAKRPEVKSRLQKYLDTMSADEYYDVGRSIKVLKALPGAEVKDREGTDRAFFYSYRFCVRGHFRQQVCGEGRQDRKLIWIEPHMKGPDQATLVHRDYVVE